VLVEQIDPVGTEALEHALDGQLDVRRAAVESRAALARLEIDVPAELGGDHDFVSERRDPLTEDALDLERAVRLCRVEKGDATVERRTDNGDHLRAVRHRRFILAAHVLDAEPNAGDLERTQSSPSHCGGCQ
jgi:hypothetical protein